MNRFLCFLLLLNSVFIASTQENGNVEDLLKALEQEALKINIVAHVLPPLAEPVLKTESSKLTLPGRPVVIQIRGENILINATLTPYLHENGKIILVAQGQVWFTESSEEQDVKFFSSFKSIPTSFGEKVFFFPLGVPQDFAGSNLFNLALEIEIVPFKGR